MEIKYHPLVVKIDIPKLDKSIRHRIKSAIYEKLGTRPEFYGIPLRHNLQNLRKVRAGDYRIVFLLQKEIIFIVAIAHRKDIYKITERRI